MQLAPFLILLIGYANQRGSTCAVSAADEIVRERRFSRLAGFALAAAASAVVLLVLDAQPMQTAIPGIYAVAGGLVAAIGVSLNGHCAMGTLASLARGRLDRVATLGGFALGVWLVDRALALPAGLAQQPRPASVLGWGLILAAIGWLAWKVPRRQGLSAPWWMLLIGLVNAVLLAQVPDWTYTSGLTGLVRGHGPLPSAFALDLGLVMAGGIFAALMDGSFYPRWKTPAHWLRALAGGILIGAGSALVPGGNDRMLLVGLPLLIPGLMTAYASFWVGLLLLRFGLTRWTS